MLTRRSVLGAAALAGLMGGLGGGRAAKADKPLMFGTAAEGTGFAIYALAFTDAMRTVDPGLEIKGLATAGTTENARRLEAGDLDLGLISGEVAHEMFEGIGRPKTKLKVLTAVSASAGLFAVRADSRYRTISDLKGRPVVWGPKGSGIVVQARYMMEGLGLDLDRDFEAIYPESLVRAPRYVLDGQAVALWGAGLRWPGFVELVSNARGARFIVPSAAEIEQIRAKNDFLRLVTVPTGTYSGQYEKLNTVGSWGVIMVREGFDDEIAYRIAGDLQRIEKAGSLSRQLAESTARNTLAAVPSTEFLQPGVLRFYQEKNLLPK